MILKTLARKQSNNRVSSPLLDQEYYDKANLSGGSVEHRFVFFDMAVQHVTRAARVFRQPGKHMQMVGIGGTGKATVARLAAFIEDCVFLRPFVSRTYNLAEFRDDLKKGFFRAGVKGDHTVLFLTDNLVKVSPDKTLSPGRRGVSHMERTGMLVGNFEINP